MQEKSTHRQAGEMTGASAQSAEALAKLDDLLRKALLALGSAGQTDLACRLAAEAWNLLRREMPREAERYSGLLHRLTATKHRQGRSLS
jgi:hypothetical protein